MLKEQPRRPIFKEKEYALEDLRHVNKCAYFDYQREKVFVRTHRQFNIINKQRRMLKRTKLRPNSTIDVEIKRCPTCQSKKINQLEQRNRLLTDLKFSRTGVKKWIIRIDFYRYYCRKCHQRFSSEPRVPKSRGRQNRYGHALMAWCVYLSVCPE